jgi:hypothetical protein
MKIAVVGYAGAGKTTASDYIVKNYGYTKINFKDALVAEMRVKLPRTMQEIIYLLERTPGGEYYDGFSGGMDQDWLFANKPPVFRALMQEFGTEIMRGIDENHWVDAWKESVEGIENLVTDDCRFLNEAQYVRDNGGMILRIIRTDIQGAGTHASEVEQQHIVADYTVEVGKGEHAKLYAKIDEILKAHGK